MIHALVLGRGLIGSSLENALTQQGMDVHRNYAPLAWSDEEKFTQQLRMMFQEMEEKIKNDEPWIIAWTAGRGVMNSPKDVLEEDTKIFTSFLHILGESGLSKRNGILFFASSAGSLYDIEHEAVTENSPTHPKSLYGEYKLKQEELLTSWSNGMQHIRILIGRIATVFGPHQDAGKSQGLITHMSRSILRRKPIHIFVPLDTIRDYVYSEDCAAHIALCLEKMSREETEKHILKIFASERVTTIAEIIGIFKRIAAQPPRIVASSHAAGNLYQHYTLFRSVVWPDVRPINEKGLLSAISAVHREQQLLHQNSVSV